MKKILAFLLLSALFLSTIGYHYYFQIQQHKLKEEMEKTLKARADLSKATELRFSLSDKASLAQLKWEDDKEFILNGEMYDVIEKKKEGGQLIIVCIKDKKETRLVNEYARINKENPNDPSSKNKSTVLLKLMSGIYLKSELPVIPTPFFIKAKETCIINGSISSAIKEILIPPPQAA